MDLCLKGKIAFIAGSSRGIGLAIAKTFLCEGANVVITGRQAAALDQARAALEAGRHGGKILSVQGDMTIPEDIHRALQQTDAAFGGIDAVVANIGNGTARGGWDLDLNDWQSALDENLLGGSILASAAMPHLIRRRPSSFTFVSSIAGSETLNAPVAYSAAKAAVLSTMKSLSRLVGPQGVRVNAVSPGNILFPGGTWEAKLADRPEFFEQTVQAEVPLQRFGRVDEIADSVVFLASERASFITGSSLVVDGGQTRSI